MTNQETIQLIGNNIKYLRKREKLSQIDLLHKLTKMILEKEKIDYLAQLEEDDDDTDIAYDDDTTSDDFMLGTDNDDSYYENLYKHENTELYKKYKKYIPFSQSTISRIEKGSEDTTAIQLLYLAEFFKVSLDSLCRQDLKHDVGARRGIWLK